ncbi:GNAT family N-acetyltransferase [Proteiniborus sp. MB09-C3]|uniref:GNAT family N-acetyltransferase n=1 Tax=Proteiniborus sp. MB09-C3 TaxID=3050072 RepID=UPI002553F7F3|nr:GNAT family N-acetyltransferase [Proteiniborus sp. MB09-C3]WIV12458.1 GNAT family N-acetyltransferase [Proteiniborus sp. MB09-C3]
MTYSIEEIKDSIAYCGLVCKLCSAGKTGQCKGCREKCDGCSIKECAKTRSINGCWECSEFPCEKRIFKNKRNRVFLQCAKDEGLHSLATYLKRNYEQGIQYHKADGTQGDYDILDSEEQILHLLRKKENPYQKCPVYETKQFIFRMVDEKDAEDLLECYSDPMSIRLFNSDNCTSKFNYKSLDEMKNCIKFWLDHYSKQYYIRFSIVDKLNCKAIGTIEFFAKQVTTSEFSKIGVLRLDLASKYEKEGFIMEIIDTISDDFYDDFEVEHIITKAIPEAKQRIAALKNQGFTELENKTIVPFDSYFIRTK